jgi:predicted GNAT family acetyltransferase
MHDIKNNMASQRFEIHENGDVAFLEYRYYKRDIALMHTEVPESMRGKGIASALAEFAFSFAKKEKKPVMVYCSFVAGYVKRHPEVKEQLDKEYYR